MKTSKTRASRRICDGRPPRGRNVRHLSVRRHVRTAATLLGAAALLAASVGRAQTPTPTPLGPGPRIPFFGPVNSDGCLECCEPWCRTTPTKTPLTDPQGRRIFLRSQGRFLLVLEGARGPNGQLPGTNLPAACPIDLPCDTTDRGDAWIMADRPLGEDPTTAVCDTGLLGGGVPAAPPLDFREEQVVTDVIRDLMCRFSVQTSSYPCTKDDYGDFAFIGSSTVRQYCFQVPQTVVFPAGDTLLAAQIRDRYGNFGERREIVVRVGNVLPAAASGQIRYYNADRPVPGASVLLVGTSPASVLTSETGEFSFSSLNSGDWTLEPEKTGDFGYGVSSLDAAYVLQVVVEKRTFTADQELACDVTGNGTLTSLDAAHILQFVTGKRPRFQVAENCASDWAFVPVPSVVPNQQIIDPAMQTGECQRGAIAFAPLEGDVTGQDFHGVLFGDCTGNWQPPAGAGGAASRGTSTENAAGWVDTARRTRRRARISLHVDAPASFHALEASLSYDVRVLRPLRARVTRSSRGALVAFNDSAPGLITVAVARANAIEARGDAVLNLEFQALPSRRAAMGVRLLSLAIDEVPVPVGAR